MKDKEFNGEIEKQQRVKIYIDNVDKARMED